MYDIGGELGRGCNWVIEVAPLGIVYRDLNGKLVITECEDLEIFRVALYETELLTGRGRGRTRR